MDVAYIEYGIQPCKIGCNENIIYHFLQLSDGFHLFYPVNVPLKDDGSIDIDYQQEIYPADKLPWKGTVHVCQLDSKEINYTKLGIAQDELQKLNEGYWNYPSPNEHIEKMYDYIKESISDTVGESMYQPSDYSYFKSILNFSPCLWISDKLNQHHLPPFSPIEKDDWELLPIFTLMDLYIGKKLWFDVLQLWNLQDLVFRRINEVYPDKINDENKHKWNEIQFDIVQLIQKNNKTDKLQNDLSNEKILVNEKIEQVIFRLRNYIRQKFPDWGRKYPNKLQVANDTREFSMKNPLFKERKDELDWLEFGDLLYISHIYEQYKPLHERINFIKNYRNSGDGAHPYETNTKNPTYATFIFDLGNECLKDFDKLENQ